ncbi:MAG: lysophospholipid acyltransferase family protein [Halanaerobiales bacterium]
MNKREFKYWLISTIAYLLITISFKWTRISVYGREKLNYLEQKTPVVYALWHGKLWLASYFFKDDDCIVLASQSRDGEYISRVLEKLGFRLVRGSSSRGGGRALLKLIRKLRKGNSAIITPDGPRGPRCKAKPGAVYLQEKSDAAIIPIGIAIKNKKILGSWDRLVLPYPGSRAVIFYGDPLYLPEDISIEERSELLENAINETQQDAEELLFAQG